VWGLVCCVVGVVWVWGGGGGGGSGGGCGVGVGVSLFKRKSGVLSWAVGWRFGLVSVFGCWWCGQWGVVVGGGGGGGVLGGGVGGVLGGGWGFFGGGGGGPIGENGGEARTLLRFTLKAGETLFSSEKSVYGGRLRALWCGDNARHEYTKKVGGG